MDFTGWVPPEIKLALIVIGGLLVVVVGLSLYIHWH